MTEKGFLKRWSERKLASREAPEKQEVEDRLQTALPQSQLPATGEQPSDAVATSAEEMISQLPNIDDLGPGSDFKAFMQEGVPSDLRKLALRKLWRSNSAIAHVDGLLDYAEDFTDAATVVENMATAYKVGGYVFEKKPIDAAAASEDGGQEGVISHVDEEPQAETAAGEIADDEADTGSEDQVATDRDETDKELADARSESLQQPSLEVSETSTIAATQETKTPA